jgi:hypothetical protein
MRNLQGLKLMKKNHGMAGGIMKKINKITANNNDDQYVEIN